MNEILNEAVQITPEKRKEVENNINKLISSYSNRNHIEIERKFLCDNIDINCIINNIKNYGYKKYYS